MLIPTKKRKATIPIGGASNKKVIESTSQNNSRNNSGEDMYDSNENSDEDESWESNIMLKDNRWSVSKGINNRKEEKSLTTTPLIIRHNNIVNKPPSKTVASNI